MILDYEIKEYFGSYLIKKGHYIDAWKQPIKPRIKYSVRFYHKLKRITILSKKDWKIDEFYKLGKTIHNQKGLVNWVKFGIRLQFIDKASDYVKTVEEMVKIFKLRKDYDKSIYFNNELKKLKNYIKRNEPNNQK